MEQISAAPQLERRQRIIRQTPVKRSSKTVPGPWLPVRCSNPNARFRRFLAIDGGRAAVRYLVIR
jgi:hypothetical protein